jgi:hypothetical protein
MSTGHIPGQPWGGYGSLAAQVEALRRARFRVFQSFEVSGRGLVVEGVVLDGQLKAGMVLLPRLERFPNVLTPRKVLAIESIRHPDGVERVGLVLENELVADAPKPQFAPGTVVDVLDREPAA